MPIDQSEIDKMFFDPADPKKTADLDVKVPRLLKEALKEAAPQLGQKYPDLVRFILKAAIAGYVHDGKVELSFFPRKR